MDYLSIDDALRAAADLRARETPAAALALLDGARRQFGNHERLLFAMAKYFRDGGMDAAALQLYQQLAAMRENDPQLVAATALTLDALNRRQDALAHLTRALAANPFQPDLLVTRALVERHDGQIKASAESLQAALALDPNHAVALANLAEVLTDMGDLSACLELQRKALAILGPHPTLRYNLSQTLFKLGQLPEAWQLYEARFEKAPDGHSRLTPRATALPRWDGQPLDGGKLLVWMEQGVGEEILYSPLLPEAAVRAGVPVIMECDPRLQPLFARSFPQIQVVARGAFNETQEPLLKAHIPAASLGGLFRNRLADFPAHQGYLKADPQKVADCRARYGGQGKVIGLSWRSKPRRYGDEKSIALASFLPLLKAKGIAIVSLQYGDVVDEIAAVRGAGGAIIHDTAIDPLTSLDDFAAQVAACDHIITVSNTTAHMAGALNVPATVLVPAGIDAPHHWFSGMKNSPWYPSLRLVWQETHGDWASALELAISGASP